MLTSRSERAGSKGRPGWPSLPASVVWQDGAKKDEIPGEERGAVKRRPGGAYGLIIKARTRAEMPSKSGNHPEVIPLQQLPLSPEDSRKSQTERKGKEKGKGALKQDTGCTGEGGKSKCRAVLKQRSSCSKSELGNRGNFSPRAPSHLVLPHACGLPANQVRVAALEPWKLNN